MEAEEFTANKENSSFVVMLTRLMEELLEQRNLQTNPARLRVGLERVLDGLNKTRKGTVAG